MDLHVCGIPLIILDVGRWREGRREGYDKARGQRMED